MERRSLDIKNIEDAKLKVSDISTYGDGDTFTLLCKASSEAEGWMKSTKVCNLPNGCLVQVSTQQRGHDGSYSVAEALTFVPDINLDKTKETFKSINKDVSFIVDTDVIKENNTK